MPDAPSLPAHDAPHWPVAIIGAGPAGLAGEAQLVQDSPDVIAMMPDVEVTTDDLPDAGGRPAGVGEAMDLRVFVEQPLQGRSLLSGEC